MLNQLINHILHRASILEQPLTPLGLNKVLYFTLRNAATTLTYNELKIIHTEPFVVTDFGPKNKAVQEQFLVYGSTTINDEGREIQQFNCLNGIIDRFIQIDPFILVNTSKTHDFHKENAPFIENGTSDIEYKLDDILRKECS